MHYLKQFVTRKNLLFITIFAVGGCLWIWAFALPAPVWNGLIPVVAVERLLFALGICGSFVAVNNLLGFLKKKRLLRIGFFIDQKYLVLTLHDV